MAESSRERLIQTAAALFAREGFNPVGLDRVIAEVGVTKTTFYNHFESKDALILAVLAHQDRVELDALHADMHKRAGDDPRAQLLAILDVFDEWFRGTDFRGCMFMNAATEFPGVNDPIHIAAVAHSENLFKLIRETAISAGAMEPDALAGQFMIILAGAIISRQVANQKDAAKFARGAAEALLNSMVIAPGRRKKAPLSR